MLLVAMGCRSQTDNRPDATMRDLREPVPLPDIDTSTPSSPRDQAPHLTIQRLDVPLDQVLDDAWSFIDEQTFPAITRGVWHANGLRLGVLHEKDVADFAGQMPQVINLFENQIMTRSHPMPIMQTAPLRPDARIPVDLTLPPRPAHEEIIDGQAGGQLQLLARLERDGDRYFVVLTPHLYRPRPNDFSNRGLLERELDGRVYDELAVRIELKGDRLIAVGLYWPVTATDYDDASADSPDGHEDVVDTQVKEEIGQLDSVLVAHGQSPADDPAAPPARLRPTEPAPPARDLPGGSIEEQAPRDGSEHRTAADLPMHFGRVLLTGTRARQPVQTMLLISIPKLENNEPIAPDSAGQAEVPTADE